LTKYLGELRERGLINEIADGDTKYFEVTKKGKEFMKEVERAQAFVGAFGLDI
jgi:predicted transcriptional regulator